MELIDLFEQMLRDEVIDAKEKLEAAIVSAQAELAAAPSPEGGES